MKKLIIALMLAAASSTCFAMPNPMVEQPSVLQAESNADVRALTVQPGTDFCLDKVYVIGGDIVELRYVNSKNQIMTIRTAKYNGANTNISGIYSKEWTPVNMIGAMDFEMTSLNSHTFAACWHSSTTSYSITMENVSAYVFNDLATNLYASIQH